MLFQLLELLQMPFIARLQIFPHHFQIQALGKDLPCLFNGLRHIASQKQFLHFFILCVHFIVGQHLCLCRPTRRLFRRLRCLFRPRFRRLFPGCGGKGRQRCRFYRGLGLSYQCFFQFFPKGHIPVSPSILPCMFPSGREPVPFLLPKGAWAYNRCSRIGMICGKG